MNGSTEVGPLVVKVPKACAMLSVGKTRLYALLNNGELDSIVDGKLRKVTVASIHAYVQRRVDAEKGAVK